MPHIAAVCPSCQSRYQLDPALRGKRMRCPNPLCRTVFEVQEEGAAPPPEPVKPPEPPKPAAPGQTVSGSVTDMLPVLSAEAVAPKEKKPPPKPPKPARPPAPPPTVAKPARPAEPPAKLPPAPPPQPEPPPVPSWQMMAPPPVRAAAVAVIAAPVEEPADDFPGDDDAPPVATEAPPAVEAHAPERRSHRSLAVIAAMLAVLLGLVGVGWWTVMNARVGSEADRFAKAEELYRQEEFGDAAEALRKLHRDFPDSADARKYRFLAELSDVRAAAYGPREDAAELKPAVGRVAQFLGMYRNDPALKDRHPDVWRTLHRLAAELTILAEREHDPEALQLARQALADAKKLQPPANVDAAKAEQTLGEKFAQADKSLAEYADRQAVLEKLDGYLKQPSAEGVREGRRLAARPELAGDAEVAELVGKLVKAHRAAVTYTAAGPAAASKPPPEDTLPAILVTPALGKTEADPDAKGTVLALARGVLHAFDAATGEPRWARRVGIDTAVLPLRIPADTITPELVLAVSSDSRCVTALAADTGAVVWQHVLADPCLGQPVLFDGTLFVPTLSGRVEEIETSLGTPRGHYQLGQRLTVGGGLQPGTSLAYFPADEFCVYVLDLAKRECAAVLYTNHAAGSLRGVPALLTRGHAGGGWMLLCVAQGTDAVEVRPYRLPIQDADQKPDGSAVKAPGWSWFAPWHDAEKVALATDAGTLSLWGIRQKATRDPLFPLREAGDFVVDASPRSARALLAHADAQNYWLLTKGRLHCVRSTFKPATGPELVKHWPETPPPDAAQRLLLGSPLHAAEPRTSPDGRVTLYLTTQALDRPACLCSAVDGNRGHVFWQRQLGAVPQHAPVALGESVLLRDASGLFLLDPATFADRAWASAGDLFAHAPLADERVALLQGKDEVIELTWPRSPTAAPKLTVRRIRSGAEPVVSSHDLKALPAGKPALADGYIVLPLANGTLARLDLREKKGPVTYPADWRKEGVDERMPGHVIALGGDEFLITDGNRGLKRVQWPTTKRASVELAHRIVGDPAVLPGLVAVADASDTLTLLDAANLRVVRRWSLPGKLSAGPFARGGKLGCVVDRKRLVWIDPEREQPVWEYGFVAQIAGPPLLTDGALVVADLNGQFVALDPASGVPLGPGYTLKANAAPATAPVPFGPGRLLAPLTDGTLLLVPLARLKS